MESQRLFKEYKDRQLFSQKLIEQAKLLWNGKNPMKGTAWVQDYFLAVQNVGMAYLLGEVEPVELKWFEELILVNSVDEKRIEATLTDNEFSFFHAMWSVAYVYMLELGEFERGNSKQAICKDVEKMIKHAIVLIRILLETLEDGKDFFQFEMKHINQEISNYKVQKEDIDEKYAIPVEINVKGKLIGTFLVSIPLEYQFGLLLKKRIELQIKLFDMNHRFERGQKNDGVLRNLETEFGVAFDLCKDVEDWDLFYLRAQYEERMGHYLACYEWFIKAADQLVDNHPLKTLSLYEAAHCLICYKIQNHDANEVLNSLKGKIAIDQRIGCSTIEKKVEHLVSEAKKLESRSLAQSTVKQINNIISKSKIGKSLVKVPNEEKVNSKIKELKEKTIENPTITETIFSDRKYLGQGIFIFLLLFFIALYIHQTYVIPLGRF